MGVIKITEVIRPKDGDFDVVARAVACDGNVYYAVAVARCESLCDARAEVTRALQSKLKEVGEMMSDENTEVLRELRRKVMAAMETGQEQIARTVIRELREYNFEAANRLRAEVVRAYNTDI